MSLERDLIMYSSNCGNISSGVEPFAIDAGLMPVTSPITVVRIHQGTIWPLPMSILSGRAAAGGLALILSVGNLGGFVGPSLIGFIRELTGRFDVALMGAAASVALGAVLLVFVSSRLVPRFPGLAQAAADIHA